MKSEPENDFIENNYWEDAQIDDENSQFIVSVMINTIDSFVVLDSANKIFGF